MWIGPLDWNFLKWGFSYTIHLPILIILCCEPNLRASVGSSMVPIMSCKTSKVSCCDYHFLASPSLHCHSFWIDVQSTECCVPVDYNNYRVENPQSAEKMSVMHKTVSEHIHFCALSFFDVQPLFIVQYILNKKLLLHLLHWATLYQSIPIWRNQPSIIMH